MTEIVPDDIILFISGVPGAGKTTISYELLKRYDKFRIIQETDILREILRGYNDFLIKQSPNIKTNIPNIYPHNKLFNYEEAKTQCEIMASSIKYIIERQKRKCIPSIINGVHIIPEILSTIIDDINIKYINLFFDCEEDLYNRIKSRDSEKYSSKCIPCLFSMNNELQQSMVKLASKSNDIFLSINVGKLNIDETVSTIINFIKI